MPTLLHLRSSADLDHSASRAIGDAFVAAWEESGSAVVVRDLHRTPPPHLADAALHWPERLRPAGATVPADAEATQRELLGELLSADVLLVEAPMYNWSLPSTLKAWIDHIHVPGVTAPFDEPTQPMAGRTAVVVSSRGGDYGAGTPTESWDHTLPPLRLVLGGSLGMTVVPIVAELTLARAGLALEDRRADADEQHAAALAEAERLGRELGQATAED